MSVSLSDSAVPLPPPSTVQEHEVRKLLKQQSSRKAACPEVSTSTLKHCANKLEPVFTDPFNASLRQHTVPVCFKAATIISCIEETQSESAERLPSRGSDFSGDEGVGATGPYISEVCHQLVWIHSSSPTDKPMQ